MRICYQSDLKLLNNRALFDTAFDPMLFTRFIEAFQGAQSVFERDFTLPRRFSRERIAVAACCDVFKSLLLRYTDRALPRGWSTQSTIRRTLSIRVAISATSAPPRRAAKSTGSLCRVIRLQL